MVGFLLLWGADNMLGTSIKYKTIITALSLSQNRKHKEKLVCSKIIH